MKIYISVDFMLTLLHLEKPKLHGVLAFLSAIGLNWLFVCFQGMHELLAPIIFVLHCDHQAFLHASEIESLE